MKTSYIKEELSRGKDFIESIEEDSNALIVSHSDVDGLISASIISQLLEEEGIEKQSQMFLLDRGEEVKKRILNKTEELDADSIIFLDYTPPKDTYEGLDDRDVLTIEHHPVREVPDHGVFVNPQEGEPPAASVLCHMLYKQMEGEKDTKPWALMGTYSDMMLDQGLEHLELNEEEKELYLHNGVMNWNLQTIIQLVNVSYIDKKESSKIFKLIKESIEKENPLLIEEESRGRAKQIMEKKRKAEKEKIETLERNSNLEVDKEARLVFVEFSSDLRIKRILANHLRTRHPGYTIAIAMKKTGKYSMSVRSSTADLSKAVPKACEGIDAHGGGHPGAAGATVNENDPSKFIENLKEELKKQKK